MLSQIIPLRAEAEGLSVQLGMVGALAGKNGYVEGDKERMTNKEDFREPVKFFMSLCATMASEVDFTIFRFM